MTPEQKKMLVEIEGIKEQIEKGHFLNVHFRAFQLSHDAWKEYLRVNAVHNNKEMSGPGGAVLDGTRD